MRTTMVGVAVLALAACGKKDAAPTDEAAAPAVVASAFDAGAAPATPEVPKPEPAPKPTRQARTDFRGRMTQGRALEKQGKYVEAMAEFEAALVIIPNNARALSELGWVAFKAGKLERSIEASRGSFSGEADPRIAGASLYNLGRALEEKKDLDGAKRAYLDSLEARPNRIVHERYLSLGGTFDPWARGSRCGAKPVDEAALCDCFRGEPDPDYPTEVSCELKEVGEWLMFTVDESDHRTRGSFETFLGRRSGAGIQLISLLGTGGIGPKAVALVVLESVKKLTVGGREVLEVDVRSSYEDEEVMTFVGSRDTRARAYCVDSAGTLRCTEPFPIEVAWSVHIGAEDDHEPDVEEWFVKEYGGKPPVSWSYRMKTELAADGRLRLSSVSGIKGYEATYQLW